MTWLKVDDGFYSHPKVLSIPRGVRAEALGTWVICGTWSADKLTDGHVPIHMIEEIGGSIVGADALAQVRLWRRLRTEFVFVNWNEWQYTREQVEANRENERKRKAAARAKAHGDAGASGNVPVGQAADTAGTIAVSGLPVPSSPRPVPDLPGDISTSPSSSEDTQPATTDGLDQRASRYGIDAQRVRRELARLLNEIPDDDTVMRVSVELLTRCPDTPRNPTAYIVGSIYRSPFEVQKLAWNAA